MLWFEQACARMSVTTLFLKEKQTNLTHRCGLWRYSEGSQSVHARIRLLIIDMEQKVIVHVLLNV